jgi:hypothetical protein
LSFLDFFAMVITVPWCERPPVGPGFLTLDEIRGPS